MTEQEKLGGLPPIRDLALSGIQWTSIGHPSGIHRAQNDRLQIVPEDFFRKKNVFKALFFTLTDL